MAREDTGSVIAVCSLLLIPCSHQEKCEYHSTEKGAKLLLACSSFHTGPPLHIPNLALSLQMYKINCIIKLVCTMWEDTMQEMLYIEKVEQAAVLLKPRRLEILR